MLSIYDLIYTIFTLVLGAVIGNLLTAVRERIAWADTRNATYDLIAGELDAVGHAGFSAFLELMKASSVNIPEYLRNMHKIHPLYAKKKGKYWYARIALNNAIRHSAWMEFDIRHDVTPQHISLFDMSYTETFYLHAFKNIDNLMSNMRVLVSIPGDMKVKVACIELEHAAIRLSYEIDTWTRIELNPPVQPSLNFLGKAVALCETLNEATYKPGIFDRLNLWWLTGGFNKEYILPETELPIIRIDSFVQ